MSEKPEPAKPKPPENASDAAKYLLERLPYVNNGPFSLGYYEDGKPVLMQMSVDLSFTVGILRGIAEGRITKGDPRLLPCINIALITPLKAAINKANEASQPNLPENGATAEDKIPNSDIVKNQMLLNTTLNAIGVAASFALFSDQLLPEPKKFIGYTANMR